MLLRDEFAVAAPPEAVWVLLTDPAKVVSCLPGATITANKGNGVYEGSIRVKFGPTVVVFRGEMQLNYDHVVRRCRIEGRGIDQCDSSRALGSGIVAVSGLNTSVVSVEGEYSIDGPLERLAKFGGEHVARILVAKFADNISRLLTRDYDSRIVSGANSSTPQMHELNAATVLRQSFVEWLRQRLRTRRRTRP